MLAAVHLLRSRQRFAFADRHVEMRVSDFARRVFEVQHGFLEDLWPKICGQTELVLCTLTESFQRTEQEFKVFSDRHNRTKRLGMAVLFRKVPFPSTNITNLDHESLICEFKLLRIANRRALPQPSSEPHCLPRGDRTLTPPAKRSAWQNRNAQPPLD